MHNWAWDWKTIRLLIKHGLWTKLEVKPIATFLDLWPAKTSNKRTSKLSYYIALVRQVMAFIKCMHGPWKTLQATRTKDKIFMQCFLTNSAKPNPHPSPTRLRPEKREKREKPRKEREKGKRGRRRRRFKTLSRSPSLIFIIFFVFSWRIKVSMRKPNLFMLFNQFPSMLN